MKRVEVLKLMDEGWELGVSYGTRGNARVSLQKGGQMKGGESINISWTVFQAMLNRKEIEKVAEPKFWMKIYGKAKK